MEQAPQLMAKSLNPVTPINTRYESAKAAGVGEKKYDEGKVILAAVESGEAAPEVLEKVRSGEVSIHNAATEIKEARKADRVGRFRHTRSGGGKALMTKSSEPLRRGRQRVVRNQKILNRGENTEDHRPSSE